MLEQEEKDAIAAEFGPTAVEVELDGKAAAIEQANAILSDAGVVTFTVLQMEQEALIGSLKKIVHHRDILSCRLRELSFAAQTTGGTSGPDRTLMLAIENARNALQYVDGEREAPAAGGGAGSSTYIGGIGPVMLTGGSGGALSLEGLGAGGSGGARPEAKWPNGAGGPGGSAFLGTIAHLNELEPTFEYERGEVDPEKVRRALQSVQLRQGFGVGKVVPVWCRLIAAARYAIEDLQAHLATAAPSFAETVRTVFDALEGLEPQLRITKQLDNRRYLLRIEIKGRVYQHYFLHNMAPSVDAIRAHKELVTLLGQITEQVKS